jgi:hypothetical protein
MYWWYRAAKAVESGGTLRAGLITTSSITQTQNRAVIAAAAMRNARITWAVADHVWYDGADGAEVRVAMTVIAKAPKEAQLVTVQKVERVDGDVPVLNAIRVPRLNADLTVHADVARAVEEPLRANAGLSSRGFMIAGAGFLLEEAEAIGLLKSQPDHAAIIKPFRNGKDLTARSRNVYVIDFAMRSEVEARSFPVLYDIVRDRVKPERDANNQPGRRQFWWRFGRSNEILRSALDGLPRYIATPETSKHRVFTMMDGSVAPDNAVVCIGSDDTFVLGVLSSVIHQEWALAAGGRMGVRDTPRYNKGPCFESFPFPSPTSQTRQAVQDAMERIEAHRQAALRTGDHVTVMKMYDVVTALRAGTPLTAAHQAVHRDAACGVLRDLHDELDAAVAAAYGWSWPEPPALILERLVTLHDRRVEEEAAGAVRWLRPEYQRPRFGGESEAEVPAPTLGLPETPSAGAAPAAATPHPWPADAIGQITVLRSMAVMTPVSIEEAVQRLVGAKRDIVHRHLETLAMLGEVRDVGGGRYAVAAGNL